MNRIPLLRDVVALVGSAESLKVAAPLFRDRADDPANSDPGITISSASDRRAGH